MKTRKTNLLNALRNIFMNPIGEAFIRRLSSNAEFGSLRTKFAPNHYQYKTGSFRAVNFQGVKYRLDISDIVDWAVYFGFSERSRSELVLLGKDSTCIIDVGANIGAVSLIFAHKHPETQIWSFEPDPHNFTKFEKNLALNNFTNVKPFRLGLGDRRTLAKLVTVDLNNRGKNKIETDFNSGVPSEQIQMVRFDEFWKEHINIPIDLIKIDVEGYEHSVLLGAKSVITSFKPKLFIEIDNNNLKEQGSSAREVISLLESWNYHLSNANSDKFVNSLMNFDNCHFDVVAVEKQSPYAQPH